MAEPATQLKCPVCGATEDRAGKPFTPRALSGHIGGAHEDYKGMRRDRNKMRAKRARWREDKRKERARRQREIVVVGGNHALSTRNQRLTHGKPRLQYEKVRTGVASVMPYKAGAYLIVFRGITQPFIAYQADLTVRQPEEESE